ncbi:MAG TPA: flavin reductase family protein [Syntrophorhabdaceae bacterium]|nr:flavin reductase family protein [Syntrophorhabdaceae bacterium]
MHELITAMIMPRPIAWISTVGQDGIFNVAPFSMFANVCLRPPIICLGIGWGRDGRKKDTLGNIEWSEDFVVNIVDETLAEPMNVTGGEYPHEVDEFQVAGLTPMKSKIVKAPFVGESPMNMECILKQIVPFGESPDGGSLIIGEAVLFRLKEDLYINGQIQLSKLKHIGRLGGHLYCRTGDRFEMDFIRIKR